jgi:hypothetical protein
MTTRIGLLALIALLAAPALASAQEPLSPAAVLRRALAPHSPALRACGVRWAGAPVRAIARFRIGFDGRARALRIEGVPKGSPTAACLEAALLELRIPQRLAFIVREVALPLPVQLGLVQAQAGR